MPRYEPDGRCCDDYEREQGNSTQQTRTATTVDVRPHPCGPDRILWCVPPPYLKPACQRLRQALEPHLPSLTLDHCWVPGRSQEAAIRLAEGNGWNEYIDIVSFFTNIDQTRLWRILARIDRSLLRQVRGMFDLLGCEFGVPEGCPFSPVLANLYLLNLDTRWRGRAVRIGDNFATSWAMELAAELRHIGLRSRGRTTFVGPAETFDLYPSSRYPFLWRNER